MKHAIVLSLLLLPALAIAAPSQTKIKIDTVPAEYRPDVGAERLQPVAMEDYYFEVNTQTGRARVVVEYTFPHQVGYRSGGDPGPRPTRAQLPGLVYDPAAHAVVYEAGGKKTVCAVVQQKKGLTGTHVVAKNTGACVVTAVAGQRPRDDGWRVHQSHTLETYFEVH